MTLYILYSADYELYLGGNYSEEKEVLIDPTDNLLDIFDNLKIPLTIFADIFSILRYKEQNLSNFPRDAENQLKEAVRRGHDVQSHVHPHWNYTRIEGKKYTVNLDYFLLGKLDPDKERLYEKILKYLTTSRTYLQNLLQPVDKNYQCIAFRAGGYGLQPNSDILIKALTEAGFVIDSSIVPDLIDRTNVNETDFSVVPRLANYYLDADLSVPSKDCRGIFEIPMPSCKFNLTDTLRYKTIAVVSYLKNSTKQGNAKGYAIQQTGNKYTKYFNFVASLGNGFDYLNCSTNEERMFECTRKYLMQFDPGTTSVFFSFNMHPKSMTEEHFSALKNYHSKLFSYYQGNIQAISFQQAAEMIRL